MAPAVSDCGELRSVRINSIPSDAGPVTYEVCVLWSGTGWKQPKYFTTCKAAEAYARGLFDGLDDAQQETTMVYQWPHHQGED
jgi:hypothetical protein